MSPQALRSASPRRNHASPPLRRPLGRLCALAILCGAVAAVQAQEGQEGAGRPLRVLMITGGGHHDFDKNSAALLAGLEKRMRLAVTRLQLVDAQPAAGQRPGALLDDKLAERFDAVLAYHQGEILGLKREELDNLLSYVRRGGAWVGIHSAADSFKWCRDYVAMVGGRFASHPPFAPLKARVLLGDHPVLDGIADFEHPDEFYYLDDCSLGDKHVVLVGEGPTDGRLRPLAWTKSYGEGRVFYTALGHGLQAHNNPAFHALIGNALRWASAKDHWAPGEEGWRRLWDGRSLCGWTMVGPGSFKIADGVLETNGGMGLLWFDRMKFRDFELELEFRLTGPKDNSGVFVRFPRAPRSAWDAVNDGYEVQICDAGAEKTRTGCIYGFEDCSKLASKPIGEWNRMRIAVTGQRYVVELNGEQVCEYGGSRGDDGYVGLQNHAAGEVVQFRGIRARERKSD